MINFYLKKIFKKIFKQTEPDPVSIHDCNIFQELDYQSYLKNPKLLDEYLCNHYNFNHGLKFFSFRKFFKLPKSFENYKYYLKSYFPEFSIVENDSVIDIGAHHGIFTINVASMGARVFSFEPNPMSFEILSKNVGANNFFHKPIINNFAISKLNNKTVEFDLGVRSTAGSTEKLKNEKLRSGKTISVTTINLDDFLEKNKISNVKLIKMDCEGAEYEIIENFKRIVNTQYLIVEAHETINYSPQQLISELSSRGFNVNKVKANYGAYELYCRKK